MAKRKKSSLLEDIIELVALLPWWAGVGMALIFYIWLHYVASQPMTAAPTDLKQMGSFVGAQFWRAIATLLQYVIPVACLFGAGISAYKRHERNQLHRGIAESPSRDALEKISWLQFEKLVGEVFRRKGFTVEERGGKGPDGGVDLVLRLGNDRYLVQCKQWKAERVGVATVRELYGVMAAEHAVGGFIVTSGQFTDDAKRFVEGRSIELVATDMLLALVRDTADLDVNPAIHQMDQAPECPSCGSPMVKRVARKGVRMGEAFWGCSRYPGCRGVRAM